MTAPRRAKTTAASNAGSYATMGLDESGVDISAPEGPDWMNATPVEVDTELADLHGKRYRLAYEHEAHMEDLRRSVKRHLKMDIYSKHVHVSREEINAYIDQLDPNHYNGASQLREIERDSERLDQIHALDDQIHVLNDVYLSRGAWPRAFLVTNSGGHVHKSMHCSTCFAPGYDASGNLRRGTEFHWLTEHSGKSEDEIVDLAGERACTVCFKDAPVSTLNKPTQMFSEDEKRKAEEKIEREKAKEEKARKALEKAITPDGSPLAIPGGGYPSPFKTEQAATTWAVDKIMYDRGFEYYAMDDQQREGVEIVKDAIGAKHGWTREEVDAHLEKKIVAKAKREKIDLSVRQPRGW